jgi:hypothetical protein
MGIMQDRACPFAGQLKMAEISTGSTSELYTWKANFSQLRNLKVKPNMAEIEAIPGRHSQSPRTRGLVQTWLRSEGNLDSKLDFFHANYQSVCDFVYYSL